ncbi:MAG: bifunctional phosphoglucose/phosphomannose isomerase, partial [Thermoplasmatota archaeon]
IVIAGMGGSAISGDFLQSYLQSRYNIPIFVNRDYTLPRWVNKHTLVFAQSYSGNTEETLSAFKNASEKKAAIIAISSGGKLQTYCERRKLPHLKIPSGYPPRTTIGYLFFASLLSLQKIGIYQHSFDNALQETIQLSKENTKAFHKDVNTNENHAKKIAQSLFQTMPHIYGWDIYSPLAKRWTTQFNENSKILARYGQIPENNHNDIVGWAGNQHISKHCSCVLFRDKQRETPSFTARFEFMKKLFATSAANTIEVDVHGNHDLAKMIYLLQLGDYVSFYLSILRNVDPTPVMIIDQLKAELDKL